MSKFQYIVIFNKWPKDPTIELSFSTKWEATDKIYRLHRLFGIGAKLRVMKYDE